MAIINMIVPIGAIVIPIAVVLRENSIYEASVSAANSSDCTELNPAIIPIIVQRNPQRGPSANMIAITRNVIGPLRDGLFPIFSFIQHYHTQKYSM